jgi:Tfp pilus assembly protein PilF
MSQNNHVLLLEMKAKEKLKEGELMQAAQYFREAIQKGSTNFQNRLLLSHILSDLERNSAEEEFCLAKEKYGDIN